MNPSARKEARRYFQQLCKDVFGTTCPQNQEDKFFDRLDAIDRQQLAAAHAERESLKRRIQHQSNLLQKRDKLIEELRRDVEQARTARLSNLA
jgi:predicted  nucleic acid-binding Zn ribbon protein